MTNQEAIRILEFMESEMLLSFDHDRKAALKLAISALEELNNSNQEVKKSNDLIGRQDAIDAVLDAIYYDEYWKEQVERAISALPSAQPEIIYCKDCVCGHCEVWLCGNGSTDVYGYCGLTNLRVLPYDYCSWSERRTGGNGRD